MKLFSQMRGSFFVFLLGTCGVLASASALADEAVKVEFPSYSEALDDQAAKGLDTVLASLQADAGVGVTIDAPMSSNPGYLYFRHLSEVRARTIYVYLTQHGISPERIAFHDSGHVHREDRAQKTRPENAIYLRFVPRAASQDDAKAATLFFQYDDSEFMEDQELVLDRIAARLLNHADTKALIIGYTDPRGKGGYNMLLATSRALVVFEQLTRRGVPAGRLRYESRGASDSVKPGSRSPEDQALSRRVEVFFETGSTGAGSAPHAGAAHGETSGSEPDPAEIKPAGDSDSVSEDLTVEGGGGLALPTGLLSRYLKHGNSAYAGLGLWHHPAVGDQRLSYFAAASFTNAKGHDSLRSDSLKDMDLVFSTQLGWSPFEAFEAYALLGAGVSHWRVTSSSAIDANVNSGTDALIDAGVGLVVWRNERVGVVVSAVTRNILGKFSGRYTVVSAGLRWTLGGSP